MIHCCAVTGADDQVASPSGSGSVRSSIFGLLVMGLTSPREGRFACSHRLSGFAGGTAHNTPDGWSQREISSRFDTVVAEISRDGMGTSLHLQVGEWTAVDLG